MKPGSKKRAPDSTARPGTPAVSRLLYPLTVAFGLLLTAIIVAADFGDLGLFRLVYKLPFGDKAGHFLLFGTMALLLDWSLLRLLPRRDPRRVVLLTGIVFAALIGLEELSQKLFPSRKFDLLDLTASYLGVLAFSLLAMRIKRP